MAENDAIKNILKRERIAKKEAEKILEDKSRELYHVNQELKQLNSSLEEKVSQRTSEIEEREQTMQVMFDNIPLPIIILELNTSEVLRANKAARMTYGYSAEEWDNLNYNYLLAEQEEQPWKKILADTSTTDYCSTHKVKCGGKIEVEINASRVSYRGQNAIILLVRDVTEIKAASRALEESNKKFSDLFESAYDVIIMLDDEGQITNANQATIRLLKAEKHEVVGRNILDFIYDEDKEMAASRFVRLLKQGSTENEVVRVVDKANEIHFMEISSTAIEGEDGRRIGTRDIARDITARLKSEQEIIRAKEIAEDSVKLRERFMANMSHEIRTPMNAIIGLSDILLQSKLDSEQTHYLDAIRKSASNLLVIINDILDFSKIKAGKLELEEKVFSLRDLIQQTSQVIYYKAEDKGIQLECTVADDVPPNFRGDPVRLNQVFLNLMSNAVKFTERGSVKFEVANDMIGDIPAVSFSVIDTGIGIADHRIDKIFESFTQADVGISGKFGGTGLGLTISKEIVSLMGGELQVSSKAGKGTTFYFSLPLPRAEAGDIKAPKSASIPDFDFKDRKVLLVDDDPINRLVARKILHKVEMVVTEAENGKDAADLALNGDFEIVLMDVQMPIMNGLEATQLIRSKGSKIPIVALTANAIKGDDQRCYDAGMDAYVSKPFKQEQLYNAMASLLKEPEPADKGKASVTTNGLGTEHLMAETAVSVKPVRISMSALHELVGGDKKFALELLSIFTTESPKLLERMRKAFKEFDAADFRFCAHRMKAQIDMIGTEESKKLVRVLEDSGKSDNLKAVELEFRRFDLLLEGMVMSAEAAKAGLRN